MSRIRLGQSFALILAAVFVVSMVSAAQVNSAPCCAIISIDTNTGIVTAKTLSTGKTFQFRVTSAAPANAATGTSRFGPVTGFSPVDGFGPVDGFQPVDAQPVDGAKAFASLKVGQKIWANVDGKVSVNGGQPCCSMVSWDLKTQKKL